jgi:hypothetical protein
MYWTFTDINAPTRALSVAPVVVVGHVDSAVIDVIAPIAMDKSS